MIEHLYGIINMKIPKERQNIGLTSIGVRTTPGGPLSRMMGVIKYFIQTECMMLYQIPDLLSLLQ